MAQHMGKVVWFDEKRGHVFLGSTGMKDMFCYRSSFQEETCEPLHDGEPVQFDVERSQEGSQAVNVKRLGWTGSPQW